MFPSYRLIDDFKYRYDDTGPMEPTFHSHAMHEIYYFHNGKCKYMIGGKGIDLVPGDLIVMNGMSEHGPVFDSHIAYVRTTVLFDGAALHPYLSQPGMIDMLKPFQQSTYSHWRLDEAGQAELEEIFARMCRFYAHADLVSFNRFRNAFFDLLLFIYDKFQHQAEGVQAPSEKEKLVSQAIQFIEQNYMNELTIDLIAESVHVSRFYFMKIFKELTNMTVFDYINLRRINQAKIWLLFDHYSVTDVCYMVGFKHPSHFSRNFKKIVGVTPEEFRWMKDT